MDIKNIVSDILQGIPVNAVLRERIELAAERLKAAEEKNVELQKKVTALEKDNRKLKNQVSEKAKLNEFIEHRGALFKRKGANGYHNAVFCRKCKGTMISLEGVLPYSCDCGACVDFTGNQLASVMGEL